MAFQPNFPPGISSNSVTRMGFQPNFSPAIASNSVTEMAFQPNFPPAISSNSVTGMAFQPNFPPGVSSNSDLSHTVGAPNMPPVMNPWMACSMPWTRENPPQLVRFGEQQSADQIVDMRCIPRPKLTNFKRKSDLDFNPKPTKIRITEEKVTAQFKNMHISNNYLIDQGCGTLFEKTDCMLPTLVLSKEVKNLTQSYQEPILPESLRSVGKPSNALVLWRPPAGSITSQMISNLRNTEDQEDETVSNVNNNSDIPDLIAMTSGLSCSSASDMELS